MEMLPTSALFTRQQLGDLAGLDDTTLNYWSREGLLVPTEGGQGRGSHRKFDFVQVNIAAILGQLRRFGLSISLMRSLADLLQASARLGAGRELHPGNFSTAARLADKIGAFRQQQPVLIRAHSYLEERPDHLVGRALSHRISEKRPAISEAEIVEDMLGPWNDHDPIDAVIAVADRLGPGRTTEAKIYGDLVFDILAPGYSDAYSWLLGVGANDEWRIEFGMEGKFFETLGGPSPEDFGPGIFLPVSGIIRKIWALKQPADYMRDREAERLQTRLADAGVNVAITPNDDPGQGFAIDPRDVAWDEIDAALDKLGYRRAIIEDETDETRH